MLVSRQDEPADQFRAQGDAEPVQLPGLQQAADDAAAEDLHARFAPPDGVTVAPAVAGGVPALRVTPADPLDATLLYLHGGGHVAGSAFGYRHLAGAIAAAARTPAVVIDYRLAPEHPYPAALQDAISAYLWLADSPAAGARAAGATAAGAQAGSKIIVVGDSSGGGLVMSLLLALRERGAPMPAGAVLLCPWIDLDARTQRPPQDSPILFSPELARRFAGDYLGGQPADDPLLTPLRTSLAGLPPLLIQAASGDSVLQEAQLLARHGQECGVDTTITIYPVPTHDFHIFWSFLPEAMDALDEAGRFIRARVSRTRSRAAGGTGVA